MNLQGRKSGRTYSPEELETLSERSAELKAALSRVKSMPKDEQQAFWAQAEKELSPMFEKK